MNERQLRNLNAILALICFFLAGLLIGLSANASEPAFCNLSYLQAHENKTAAPRTKRLHSYQLGELTLNGLAVGASDANEVAGFSYAPKAKQYCTWYFGAGNDLAENLFHHVELKLPLWTWLPWISNREMGDDFERLLNPQLPEMLSCVESYGYFAEGCDAQRHRGPSVFAWFFGVAGCSPESSANLANAIWSLNGVKYSTRLEIAKRGFEVGNKFPEYRSRFQRVMLSRNPSQTPSR